MANVGVNADLSGITGFVGAVEGFLNILEDPRIEGMLLDKIANQIKRDFYKETYAAAESGSAHVKHVYEWGSRPGEISPVRLYDIVKRGDKNAQVLSYRFKPSTVPVPLPDTSRMKGVRGNFTRHVFTAKALVMETQDSVNIYPVHAKKLFIPDENAPRGFVMVDRARVNPGGANATNGFYNWWNTWFEARGNAIQSEVVDQARAEVLATGQKVVRYAAGTVKNGKNVGGQFASGNIVMMGNINAVQNRAELIAEGELKRAWRSDDDFDEDGEYL